MTTSIDGKSPQNGEFTPLRPTSSALALADALVSAPVPALVARTGAAAGRRFLEFFAVTIRNRNTREAYARALGRFFDWCAQNGVEELHAIHPMLIAAYIEQHAGSAPTRKQHLAAIRMCFDWLVTGQVVPSNPATSVKGPSHVVTTGKTSVLAPEEARQLLDSISTNDLVGLRDRALIGVMVYSFARVSAAVAMRVEDFYRERKRHWFRLHEKGGKEHAVPAHHNAEAYVDAYLEAARIAEERGTPLFRTLDRDGRPTAKGMGRVQAFKRIRYHARRAGLETAVCCHTFRATGITAYLSSGGTLEKAQQIAAHSSPRTTKLYDRTRDELTLDEIEKIQI